MEFISRFKNALFLMVVLLAQAITLAVQVRNPVDPSEPDGPRIRLIRLWAADAITPFERFAHATGAATRNTWLNYIDLRHVRERNRDLQSEITRIRIEEAAMAEDAIQGHRLQALLGFREKYVGSTVAAQVIGSSGSDQSHVLTIDKGSRDGLRPDMAVITPDGIVGKLRDVFPTTSQVLEIDDPTSGAGVVLADTRTRAVVRGSVGGRVEIDNLTADSRIRPGEQVLTSGGDQVFPRGLPVGSIESIAPDPKHQPYTEIVVKPAVSLARVEEVLVISGTQAEMPDSMQEDLSTAASQHSAEISAERLPGIHEDLPKSPASGALDGSASPSNGVPKPVPALRPDRYSAGVTPPAADLQPGAANPVPPGATEVPRQAHPLAGIPPQ